MAPLRVIQINLIGGNWLSFPVYLNSPVFLVTLIIRSTFHEFKSQKTDYSIPGYLCEDGRSKREIRNKIIDKHTNFQGYKTISRDLNIPVSTVRNVIKKNAAYRTLSILLEHGQKRKTDQRSCRWLVWMVEKAPRMTSKELKVDQERAGAVVSVCTTGHWTEKAYMVESPGRLHC